MISCSISITSDTRYRTIDMSIHWHVSRMFDVLFLSGSIKYIQHLIHLNPLFMSTSVVQYRTRTTPCIFYHVRKHYIDNHVRLYQRKGPVPCLFSALHHVDGSVKPLMTVKSWTSVYIKKWNWDIPASHEIRGHLYHTQTIWYYLSKYGYTIIKPG